MLPFAVSGQSAGTGGVTPAQWRQWISGRGVLIQSNFQCPTCKLCRSAVPVSSGLVERFGRAAGEPQGDAPVVERLRWQGQRVSHGGGLRSALMGRHRLSRRRRGRSRPVRASLAGRRVAQPVRSSTSEQSRSMAPIAAGIATGSPPSRPSPPATLRSVSISARVRAATARSARASRRSGWMRVFLLIAAMNGGCGFQGLPTSRSRPSRARARRCSLRS